MTFPSAARPQLGELPLGVSALPAQARPRPARALAAAFLPPPAARPALPPPPGPQRRRAGPGVGEPRPPAPAPSPPTRTAPSSLLSLLLAFPAARASPARESSSQLFLPERAQAEGRLPRSCSLGRLPSRLRSSGSGGHEVVAAGGPCPPTSAVHPGLLASAPPPRDSPGLRWLSSSPAPCVPAPGSRRNPPSPFASSRCDSPPLLRQPLESIPWGIGARPRRTAFPRGTLRHRRGRVSR